MAASFVHLRLHTEYSLVDGLIRIKSLIKQTVTAGMPAVAVTDMSNLFALIKFYKAALGSGVKPIVGVEAWVRHGDEPARLLLLCQNLTGYHNLTRLVSRGFLEGQQRGVPIIDSAWLAGNTEGLIALSGGREGELGRALLNGQPERASAWLADWRELFPERFYLEVQRTGRPQEEAYLGAAVDLAVAAGVPVVATNEVCFLQRSDFEAHEARVCIHDGMTLDDPRRPRRYSDQQYLKTPAEMADLFADLPEALENSLEIARRCNLRLELGKNVLPDFPVPADMTAEAYFSTEARAGLEARLPRLLDLAATDFLERRKIYDERLTEELGVIIQMGFPGYFLIVADFIRWAREHGVPVGPGRGSGAGSLVAYALGITDLDPLAYDLLFERFLNPERVSMPDFDIDFCMEGRDRVIDYVAQRYGRDRVSQIATHGSMAAKAVVRDVGRVLGHPYGFVDRIAKLIPFEIGMTLEKAIEQEAELRRLYEGDEEVRALIELARKLEGLARNVGKHAGGVVIAPSNLTDFSPLYCEEGGQNLVTQFDKDDVEAAGLVKFDFLGLRTLTIIDWAVQTINQQRLITGEAPLDITTIPLDDAETFDLLRRHQTTAVFQLESSGMKDLIRRLQPDCFEDIVALVALFRPGPLQSGMVDDFIDRKHGHARIEYPHPALANVLRPTYGVILYQEQVMQIAQVLAGYTLGGADLLRRAMGKKKAEEMAKQRETFVKGAVERQVETETATYIFDLMEKFAGYGFNKSHSAAYALVSYQTAWLKAHYPAAFMAAVLSSDMDKTDKVVVFIEECRRLQLQLTPPDINLSEYRFAVGAANEIRYGLGAIKGVGESAIETLLEERQRGGAYHDLFDLCQRVELRKLNRRVLEALIRSGAIDALGPNRATLAAQLPEALREAEQLSRNDAAGQDDLFGLVAATKTARQPLRIAQVVEWAEQERLRGEKEALGIYLSGHPVNRVAMELVALGAAPLENLLENGTPRARSDNRSVLVGGLVVSLRTRNANRGGRIAFVTLENGRGRLEIRLFPEVYERHRQSLAEDAIVLVEGTLGWDEFNQTTRLNVERVLDLDGARAEYARRLMIRFDAGQCQAGLLRQLRDLLAAHRANGCCVVWVDYRGAEARVALTFGASWCVKPSETLLEQLHTLLGSREDAVLQYEPQSSVRHNHMA
ncbi:MAG TPA: DNA polymerase III subunit alpha [Candidatus Competibacter denitrificans]|nr:DNA polymerase III subunit alpha [Candidatus Competibacter denitrificans]HRC69727.1 DNA polymerase III subunit alpha [Candidatus Competibacter denitrificans]